MLTKYTDLSGMAVWVNRNHITHVEQHPEFSAIHFVSAQTISVTATAAEIKEGPTGMYGTGGAKGS